MNALALVSLAATLACIVLGFLVFYYNRKPFLNKLFFLLIVTGFVYSFTTVMMWNSANPEEALMWHKAGTIWPFFVAAALNFALVFTNSKWIKSKKSYLALYLPAAAFCFVDLFTDAINTAPVLEYWGYNDLPAGTWVYGLSAFWTALLPILAFGVCLAYYRKTKDKLQKKMNLHVTVGLAIPILVFIITNMLTRNLHMDIPNLGPFSTLFTVVFISYAIVKYGLFTMDARLAAENIVSTIPDPLILANMDSKIIQTNRRMMEFSGYSEKELLDESVSAFSAGNQQEWQNTLDELIREKKVSDKELTFKTKNSEKRSVLFSGSVVQTSAGRDVGLTIVIHDITERKKAEDELKDTKNRLETLLNSMLSGIIIIDAKTHEIIDANKAALEILEASREEVVGEVCHNFVCQAQRGRCPITDLGFEVDNEERPLWTLNGKKKRIIKSVAKLQLKDRLLLVENFIDISQRKLMEEKLEKSQRLASVGELAGQLGHDLRNPLTGIKNGIYLVKKKGNKIGEEEREEILSVVERAVEDSNRIVTSLIDYSYDLQLQPEMCTAKAVVTRALLSLRVPSFVTVQTQVDDDKLLFLDEQRMQDVFARILQNSIDAIEEEGSISVRSSVEGDNLSITFTDTGVGIPKEVLPRLFLPFVTTKAKGMGLSLAICKRIVETHAGKISLQSKVGVGTELTVTLPIATTNVDFVAPVTSQECLV